MQVTAEEVNGRTRTQRLRDAILAREPHLCAERAIIYTSVFEETIGEPMIIRRAKAFRKLLAEMTIYIADEELIVGNQAGKPRSAPVYPETEAGYLLEEGFERMQERHEDPFVVPPQVREKLMEALPKWKCQTVGEVAPGKMPARTRQVLFIPHRVFHPEIHLLGGIGHVAVDFNLVLKRGFEALKNEAEERLNSLSYIDPEDHERKLFYEAAIHVMEGVLGYARRYAELAENMAREETDPIRKQELRLIAENCSRVPARPARNFYEAVQAIWFSHLFLQIEANGMGVSPGRLDQFLYPYYQEGLDKGNLTHEDAQEILECLWVKVEEIKRAYDSDCARNFAGYDSGMNVSIAGQKSDGTDATNEVSYMFLDAQDNLRTARPNFTIRYHNKLSQKFLLRACEVMKIGTGMPEIMNDEAHIPSLMNRGVTLEDARAYTNIGCVEPAVPGKTCSWSNAAMFNLGKCLELALNDGKCMFTGERIGVQTGDPLNFSSIEDIKRAFAEQVVFFVKHMVIAVNAIDLTHKKMVQTPYLSLLVSDCMQKGRDVTAGGAHYNFTSPQGVGIADVADSLSAMQKLVFEEKTIAMSELLEALRTNFEGREDLRQTLINKAPKYGNDDDYVDHFARWAGRLYCKEVEKYRNPRGGYFQPGLYPVSANVPLGRNTAALPSGRLAALPLADGISPYRGMDKKGPTGVIRSVGKIDQTIASNGTLLNQKLSPILLDDPKGLRSLADLIRSYCDLGGKHIQFNVVDSNTLRAAQENPGEHSHLVVRVAGYSAYFTQLNKDVQDDIIARTEQTRF